MNRLIELALLVVLLPACQRVVASEFYLVPDLIGSPGFGIEQVSADGSAFGGTIVQPVGGVITPVSAFRWSWETGLTRIMSPDRKPNSFLSLCANGLGVIAIESGQGEVFAWTAETGSRALGVSPPGGGFYLDASTDGTVLVGHKSVGDQIASPLISRKVGNDYEHIILEPTGNVRALGITADGSVVVGQDVDQGRSFFWTATEGMTYLGTLPGYDSSFVEAVAGTKEQISADGSVIAGLSFGPQPGPGFRWTNQTGMSELGFLAGYRDMHPMTVSADGRLILGWAGNAENDFAAFIWDEGHGTRNLQEILSREFRLDASLADWILTSGAGISSDRRSLYGHYYGARGESDRMWIARLDRPLVAFDSSGVTGDFNNDRLVDVTDVDVLRSAIRDVSTEKPYDVNRSSQVEFGDLNQMIHGVLKTWFGDANLDGQFNTNDLVSVFQAGQYEDGTVGNSTWSTGDWNADGDFTTSDLVSAFQDGGYEHGPRPGAQAVPEPASWLLISLSGLVVHSMRRRKTTPKDTMITKFHGKTK